MHVQIFLDEIEMGKAAGSLAATSIKDAIAKNGRANIILATGTSQFEVLKNLVADTTIDWSKVTMFHLDEYIGLDINSPAGFGNYLRERFVSKVPSLKNAFIIDGNDDPEEECNQMNKLIEKHPIDVALIGIGENGHLAFNDPPADFQTFTPFIIVELDEKCRQQQLGEGWFPNLDAVPRTAITMSIQQILKSKKIICSVPGKRKAEVVKSCAEIPISNLVPATILREHADCHLFLDADSAALLAK
ncbi:MAG: glucosamine-6-phosphate deaminase [Bacteroidetes bacterium]|nr:MAG: glucosamine-6-phosphate deaminase [Bacteroidota bacterium]